MASRFSRLLFAAVIFALPIVLAPQLTLAAQARRVDNMVPLPTPAGAFIQQLGDRALSILADQKLAPEDKNRVFQQLLRESFDLPTVARFVIGRNAWFGATEEEKSEYLRLFEKLVVKIYSDRFSLYSGEAFKVIAERPEGERDTMVTSHIVRPDNAAPIIVDWRVRNFSGRLAIIDVIVEGISMSVTQRQEYGSILQRNDNRLTPLVELMRENLEKQGNP